MLHRKRLIPFFNDRKMIAFITFFIGNPIDESRFARDDMWSVLDDDKNGSVCFIDHLISKDDSNQRRAYKFLHDFRKYIKDTFHNVKYIHWRRWNKRTNEVKIYKKEI